MNYVLIAKDMKLLSTEVHCYVVQYNVGYLLIDSSLSFWFWFYQSIYLADCHFQELYHVWVVIHKFKLDKSSPHLIESCSGQLVVTSICTQVS